MLLQVYENELTLLRFCPSSPLNGGVSLHTTVFTTVLHTQHRQSITTGLSFLSNNALILIFLFSESSSLDRVKSICDLN